MSQVYDLLNQALERGQCKSLQDFALLLKELEQTAAASEPFTLATVKECQALAVAARQAEQFAADRCQKDAVIQERDAAHKWLGLHLKAKLLADYGRQLADDASFQASINLLQSKVVPLAKEFHQAQRLAVSFATLGNVLGMIGQRRKGTRYLEDAIHAFEAALQCLDSNDDPVEWASVQNSLGNALGSLGQRSSDDALLQRSIEAFELALTKQSEQTCAHDWASTMNNLAAALQSVGRKQNDAKVLKRSVESYKAVLRIWTRAEAPLDWATTMDHLGTALRTLGEHRRGPGTLKQAVAAYNSALAERTRELTPNDWAMTHNNLGAALQKLALREEKPEILQKAILSYEQSLTHWTQEAVPMTWAMTMANLGVARGEFARLTGDIESARLAVKEIQSAVDLFRSASHAQYTELGEEQLSKARRLAEALVEEQRVERAGNEHVQH